VGYIKYFYILYVYADKPTSLVLSFGWTVGDGGRPGMVRDGGGLPGTARVMSHEVKTIRLEVYDLNLASTGGPSARTIVP